MIHDSTPHRIFRISELTRLIASQLILISPKSTVNLACACRYLEEPVLSSLWGTHLPLDTLLKVLPQETWRCDNLRSGKSVVCGPNPRSRNRMLKFLVTLVQDHGGSVTRSLEQSPPLCLLDAQSLRG